VTALTGARLAQGARVTGSARLAPAQPGAAPIGWLQASERELLGIRGRDIAMIFQEPMTALNRCNNVGRPGGRGAATEAGLTPRQAWEGAVEALAATGISRARAARRKLPAPAVGRAAPRAMIAMALASRPRLLLADEPTTALDVTLRQQILELLADPAAPGRMAVQLITHDLNLVRAASPTGSR